MVYSSRRSFGILAYDTYKGYEYLVISYGTHPCAYIRADKLTKKQIDYINENCHGGITFRKQSMGNNIKNVEGEWIGWDKENGLDGIMLIIWIILIISHMERNILQKKL